MRTRCGLSQSLLIRRPAWMMSPFRAFIQISNLSAWKMIW